MQTKTVFISCFFNLVARNVLETSFFQKLRSRTDLKIVLLAPQGKGDFFRKEFGGSNVAVEEVPTRPMSKPGLLFHLLAWNLLRTKSKEIHRFVQLGKDRNYARYFFTSAMNWFGGRPLIRRAFRYFDAFMPSGGFDYLFDRYRPDLVFATDIQDLRVQELSDTALIRAARRRGVNSVGMSRSWDSMTTKGLLRTLPDLLVVQTDNIKSQAVAYHSVPADRVVVVGVPHYDSYITGTRTSREDFFKRIGLDPAKKLIFFAPPSDIWTGDKSLNPFLFKTIASIGEQVVARFPIFGELDLGDFARPANMVFDRPTNSDNLAEALLAKKDDAHFANLLYHSDVVVTGPSSVILDASLFNKPTILIGFDGEKIKPYWQRLSRYYDYEHQDAAIRLGELRVAKSRGELVEYIKEGLSQPKRGEEGRRRLANSFCQDLDGRSGERLAAAITDNL
ncbi:MAG: CDP-glycerol glycerophosphotransferase family protein [bacterium]|nr:CDP-glycerol glycerophosphotransferase family protein [bacterium]